MTEKGKTSKKTAKKGRTPQRAPAAAPRPPSVKVEPLVIGIGASAGGLEALTQFLEAMPPGSGVAFVHIQHLDPRHKSMMVELLRSSTPWTIVQAEDEMAVQPGIVYINPPDRDVAIFHGRLRLIEPAERHGLRLPIDFFFRSLAQDRRDRAISIILSGSGSDGTLGMRAIKAAGGLALVQDEKSARYDGMPRSAIATQLADIVLPPREIARVLVEYLRHPYVKSTDAIGDSAQSQMEHVFMLLRQETGHDFSAYKQNTIRRRIERRMAVHQLRGLDEYVRHLQRSPGEVEALFREILVGVTSFFRDPAAFDQLAANVIPEIFKGKGKQAQVRVWVAGCSTGEEAYSLAILLAEHASKTRNAPKACVFATDIDQNAIDVARAGLYSGAIAGDVSAERLKKYFTKDDGHYRIAKEIRDMVIFAKQDVLKDPPFSKLDLISCRNLLIYFGGDLQRRLLPLFQAVLNHAGFLFLGSSETIGDAAELFTAVDRKWKIFRKRPSSAHPAMGLTSLNALNETLPDARAAAIRSAAVPVAVGDLAQRMLLDLFAPACVVVDERYAVVFSHGSTGKYLDLPSGEPVLDLLKMARADIVAELRAALHRAAADRGEVTRATLVGSETEQRRMVRIRVRPLRGARGGRSMWMVTFEEMAPAPSEAAGRGKAPGRKDPRVRDLERELMSTRETLESTIEEVETSSEELRSTNEEIQSANEELQSTNEELETSKEEIQSVNEELLTVNAELQKKIDEITDTNDDLTNLLNSTQIGTIFLDNDLRIKRFTPAMSKLMNLIPSDAGRPISDMAARFSPDDLGETAAEVLRSLSSRESEVRISDRAFFLRRVLPYRTVANTIDGVVITFVNISDLKEAQLSAKAALVYAEGVVDTIREALVALDGSARVVIANQAFCRAFKTQRQAVIGARLYDLNWARWARGAEEAIDRVISTGEPFDGLKVPLHERPGAVAEQLTLSARRIQFEGAAFAGQKELTLLVIGRDATPWTIESGEGAT